MPDVLECAQNGKHHGLEDDSEDLQVNNCILLGGICAKSTIYTANRQLINKT
jgi:hypothetical protein